MDIKAYLSKKKEVVDKTLEKLVPDGKAFPPVVHEAMRYSLFAGGKRVRPILAIAAAEALGGKTTNLLPSAASIELIHTYSLIHDDLPAMDDDDFRRGRPTCHKAYGEAIAILAGDGLLNMAFETLSDPRRLEAAPAGRLVHIIREISLASGIYGMVVEVLRGNRGDTTTLQALLRTLRRRLGINEAVFVFDGGMSSKVNLAALEALGLRYVTRLGAGALEELLAQLPADQAPELWDRTQVMEIVREGKRYVIAGGPWRQQRDQQRRQARLTKAEAELKRLAAVKRKKIQPQKLASQVGRALQRLKAHKYFEYAVDPQGQLQWKRRNHLIQAEAVRDGLYLLTTNATVAEIPSPGVVSHYKNLLDGLPFLPTAGALAATPRASAPPPRRM